MSAETGWLLVVAGTGLAVAGMAMLWVATARVKRRRRGRLVRSFAGRSGVLTCTSVAWGVITGVQWAVLCQTGPGVAWVVVLWLPAVLAGVTAARLLVVLRIVHGRRRRVRAVRREQGSGR